MLIIIEGHQGAGKSHLIKSANCETADVYKLPFSAWNTLLDTDLSMAYGFTAGKDISILDFHQKNPNINTIIVLDTNV